MLIEELHSRKAWCCLSECFDIPIIDVIRVANVECFGTAIGEVNVAVKIGEVESIIGDEGRRSC